MANYFKQQFKVHIKYLFLYVHHRLVRTDSAVWSMSSLDHFIKDYEKLT